MRLKETAGICRYLKALALERQGPARHELDRLAQVIWLQLLEVARIELPDKAAVIHFLEEHASTYLHSFDIGHFRTAIEAAEPPYRMAEAFRPPKLLGGGRSSSGGGPARLQDDLTERIYASYYALKRTGIHNARGRISDVLNALKIPTNARPKTDSRWGSAEVIERVRQFEQRLVRQHELAGRDDRATEIIRLRNMLVDSWIHLFHFDASVRAEGNQTSA
jgi:hypothetical protein